jgi:hypothetical protein
MMQLTVGRTFVLEDCLGGEIVVMLKQIDPTIIILFFIRKEFNPFDDIVYYENNSNWSKTKRSLIFKTNLLKKYFLINNNSLGLFQF